MPGQEGRSAHAQGDADQAAERAQHDRLDQELEQDVTRLGAHGHPDADLAGALGHAHEHDVHDANAANQERDARDRPQQHRHDPRGRGREFRDLRLGPNREIFLDTFRDAMALTQQAGNLLLNLRHDLGALGLNEHPADGRRARQPFHGARVGNQNHVILIVPTHRGALRRQQAHDHERDVPDPDHFADRIAIAE